MVNLKEVKQLCEEHDKCLKKTKVINHARRERIWLKVIDARGYDFYLSEDEIDMLSELIDKKGMEIENKIQDMFLESDNNENTYDYNGNTYCKRCGDKVEGGYCSCFNN